MKKFLPFLMILTLASCVHKKSGTNETNENFNYFKDRWVDKIWQLNPTWALYTGYHNYDSIIVIPTPENIQHLNTEYKALLDSMKTYDKQSLTDNNRIDYMMMQNYLESSIWYNTDFRSYEWDPSQFNVGGDFAQILSENYDKLDNRLRMFSKRLEKVPVYYAKAREIIKKPTLEHTELAIQQNQGALGVFEKMLQNSLIKSELSNEEKIALNVKADAAKKAITDYVLWLTKEVKPSLEKNGARDFRIGKTLYDKKFQYDIVSGYSAEQIYQKALKRKDELHEEMAGIAKRLWPKYFGKRPMPASNIALIKSMIDTLAHTHVNRDSLITAIKHQLPELVDFINKKNILYIDPKKPLVVRETPLYMQGVAGASVSSPGLYEKNANTYYNVTPLNAYKADQAESYLREYNHYILQILNIHEAIPGHYTQLVYSNQSASIIKGILGSGSMVEGWAVYTERMMLEEGYGNNEPEMWLMYYKWHMRVVCNTILDYSVHVKGMSKEDAMKLLMENAFQERAEAEGKWRRVTLTQVQLCSYFTGFTEIYDFRNQLKNKLGDKFNLKRFHEKFLSYGSAPVKYIKELMNDNL